MTEVYPSSPQIKRQVGGQNTCSVRSYFTITSRLVILVDISQEEAEAEALEGPSRDWGGDGGLRQAQAGERRKEFCLDPGSQREPCTDFENKPMLTKGETWREG